ncbi:Lcl C-terminal domain-containing protein [Wenzhouxiangella marina]|uniref:Lcl C-terminal domain-containing protein n=1 Tax=Wenzhouxiangella marina TaxID=1579979 RepID=A0A0K0XV87_9GAMM|nr:DUF1566 domain-containing protein [Wenzhouxiangella marina]AKS41593.1 hypothetical protein WM2015_1219 [Wenzhouxiangella marina]MBB6086648.1 hypothetical protein [Wenzhouxiangella marina]
MMPKEYGVMLTSLLLALAMTPDAALAQCAAGNLNPAVPASAPLTEFDEQGDGSLLHRRTRLIWQRCALGQTWDGAACTGAPSLMDWTTALLAAASTGQGGDPIWRLPNRNELASIVEQRCFSPALDADAFPAAPAVAYWTSTPVSDGGEQVWIVEFGDGATFAAPTDALQAVRLVRDLP